MADAIVHALHEGRPLCLFQRGVPGDWPAGHAWAGVAAFKDPEKVAPAIRCLGCVAVLDEVADDGQND